MSSGAQHRRRRPRRIGDAPTDLGAWEQLPARLARRAGQQRPVLRRGPARPAHGHGPGSEHARRPRSRQASSRCCPTRTCHSSSAPPDQRLVDVLQRPGQRPRQHDDPRRCRPRRRRRRPRRSATRSRRTGTTPTSRLTDDGTTWTPVPTNLSHQRPDPNGQQRRRGHHRLDGRCVGRPDRDRPGRHDRDPVPLLDRRGRRRPVRLPGRRHRRRRSRPSAPGRDRRRGLDLRRVQPSAARRADGAATSTPTSRRTASTTATTPR